MTAQIHPFRLEISEAELDDLRERLARTRWPEPEPVDDWSQGVPLSLQELCRYWETQYDARRLQARLNPVPQFRTDIGGLGIHFLHARSPEHEALPLIVTHGWPGSVTEFLEVIGPLTDPRRTAASPRTRFTSSAPRCRATASATSPPAQASVWPGLRIPGRS